MSDSTPGAHNPLTIRLVDGSDREAALDIFMAVIATGDTYVYSPNMSRADAAEAWFPVNGYTFVAERDAKIVGTYALKPNQPGLGSHVANAGYMVAPGLSSGGVGSAMCEHSLVEARRLGFRAMQFNFVVSTNTRAVALWQRMGFAIVGTVPGAFHHASLGDVDTYVMHRWL